MAGQRTLSGEQVLEMYFLETRAKLLEVAATLDRVERAGGVSRDDRRMVFIRQALEILQGEPQVDQQGRAERVQRLYSVQ